MRPHHQNNDNIDHNNKNDNSNYTAEALVKKFRFRSSPRKVSYIQDLGVDIGSAFSSFESDFTEIAFSFWTFLFHTPSQLPG